MLFDYTYIEIQLIEKGRTHYARLFHRKETINELRKKTRRITNVSRKAKKKNLKNGKQP